MSDAGTGALKPDTESALDRFAAPDTSPLDRKAALTQLIEAKVLPKSADDPRVQVGRRRVLDQTRSSDPLTQLLGIAENVRLTQVVKRWAAELPRQLEEVFSNELPAIELLPEATDRLNAVRACGLLRATWLPRYLSTAVASEDTGEKARAEALRVLAAQTSDLSEFLRSLADAFETLRPLTDNPGDTVARRLIRTLSALRELLLDADMQAGSDFGRLFEELLSRSLLGRRPQSERVQTDLAREALLTLHDALRTQLTLIVDAAAYSAVSYCRRLCGGGSWPQDLQRATDKLISDVMQALLLLGRQGRRDQAMLDNLTALTNFPERARALATQLAETHADLPEDVRDWLATGKVRPARLASRATVEASASSADEAIGLALQDTRLLRETSNDLSEPLLSNLELLDPALAAAARGLFAQVSRASVQVEQVAALRNIGLLGRTGETIDAAPKYFEVVGDHPSPTMTVRQPAVVRIREGAVGDVILKGLVE